MRKTENALFRRAAETILGNRWLFLGLLGLITLLAVFQIVTSLRVDNSTEYFAGSDTAVSRSLDSFRDDFGRDDHFFILAEGDIFTTPVLQQLSKLHDALEAFDLPLESLGERRADRQAARSGIAPKATASESVDDFGSFDDDGWGDEEGGTVVEEVTSLINFRQTLFEDGAIRVRGLMENGLPTQAELPALRKAVLSNPTMVGNIIGPEAHHTVLTVRTQFMNEDDSGKVNRALEELAATFEQTGLKLSVTGMPSLNTNLNAMVIEDTGTLFALAATVMALVLMFLFRRLLSMLAPLGVVGLSGVWTLGMMATTGTPMTILSSVIPAFLVCVGLGDSIHILAVQGEEIKRGTPPREAMVRAIAGTGIPITFTTLTTMAGLLSFQFASAPAIQEMGLAGAFGVFMALINSVVFLPIVMSFQKEAAPSNTPADPSKERTADWIDRFLDRAVGVSRGRGLLPTLGVAVLVAIVSGIGMSKLYVYHNPLVWLGEEHPTTIGITTMDTKVGGISSLHVVFDSDSEHGIKDRELLLKIDELAEALSTYIHPVTHETIVTGTISLGDIVKETNRALHGGDEAFYTLPDTQRGVSDALLLFENAGPEELSRIATADLKRTHLTVRVKWMDASSYGPFQDFVNGEIERIIGDTARASPTGAVYSILSVVQSLITDLLRSFGVALTVITLMMITLFRSLKLGLISMVPNLLPIATVMGFMGFVGIPIDMSNLVIASIIIGIAVDDTVHFLHQYRISADATGSTELGIEHALRHAGRAMVSTTVVLTLGFGVFMASRMGSIQNFGLLIGFACTLALIMDLVFGPALLRFFYPQPPEVDHA